VLADDSWRRSKGSARARLAEMKRFYAFLEAETAATLQRWEAQQQKRRARTRRTAP
jgi:hypothetical protein